MDIITVTDFVDSLNSIDIGHEAAEAIDETKEAMKELQRDQLLHGIRGDGKRIGKYKNDKYAAKKFAMNPLAGLGNVDLKLTGDVHKEIFVDVRETEFIIDSADPKMGELIEKYGDPLGLTEENDEKYIDGDLDEAFVKRIENKTGL